MIGMGGFLPVRIRAGMRRDRTLGLRPGLAEERTRFCCGAAWGVIET